jgi:hypothetical protein
MLTIAPEPSTMWRMREPVELQLTGSVSGATRPRLDSWLGYCGGFDSLALEWNRGQPPGCRRCAPRISGWARAGAEGLGGGSRI